MLNGPASREGPALQSLSGLSASVLVGACPKLRRQQGEVKHRNPKRNITANHAGLHLGCLRIREGPNGSNSGRSVVRWVQNSPPVQPLLEPWSWRARMAGVLESSKLYSDSCLAVALIAAEGGSASR